MPPAGYAEPLVLRPYRDLVVKMIVLIPDVAAVDRIRNLEALAFHRLHSLMLWADHVEIAEQDVVFRQSAALFLVSTLAVLPLGKEARPVP